MSSPSIHLLGILEQNPGRLQEVANYLTKFLSTFEEKNVFFDEVFNIFEHAAGADVLLHPTYIDLFRQLVEVGMRCPNGQISTVKHALSSYITQPFKLNENAFRNFRRQIPFMTLFFERHILSWGIFKSPLKALFALGPTSAIGIWYVFEVVRLASSLIDRGQKLPSGNADDDPFWCGCVDRLKEAYDKGMVKDRLIEGDMYSFFKQLKKMDRWYISSSRPKERSRKLSESNQNEPSKRPRPPSNPYDEVKQVKQQEQTLSICEIMAQLTQSPDYLAKAIRETEKRFRTRTDFISFCDDVFEILNATFSSPNEAALNSCVKLLSGLRDFELKLPSAQSISFREVVLRCTNVETRFEKVEEVDKFRSSFRLTNELYRIGLVPQEIFENYAATLANGDDKISQILLFRIVENVFKLFETGVLHLNNEFWEQQTNRLDAGCQHGTVFDQQMSQEVSKFFASFKMAGGWRKQQATNRVTNAQASAYDCESKDEQLISLISSISLIGDIDIWLLPFIARLKEINAPYDFAVAISLVMVKVFEQIGNCCGKNELEAAGKACARLCSSDFGRAKRFRSEFRDICLKYLCGRQAHELEKEKVNKSSEQSSEIEATFFGRRIGCVRLVCELFSRKVIDLTYIVILCDSLIATRTEPALECLLRLIRELGNQLAGPLLQSNQGQWWQSLFDEISKLKESLLSSKELKELANDVLLQKINI